jgi:hypothetical protein
MTLTILFSNSKNYNPFFLWFRKTFLRHRSTHVSFGIQKDNQPYIFHMSSKGAVRTPRAKFLSKNLVIKEYRILPDLSDQLLRHLQYLGAPYHQMSAIWHFLALLCRPIKQLLIFYRIKNMFYCANFARQLDQANQIQSWRKIDPYWASVEELQLACETSSEFQEASHDPSI